MAELSPARRRLAILFVAVGIGLIVERTVASGGDVDAAASPAPAVAISDARTSDAPASGAEPGRAADKHPRLRLDELARRNARSTTPPANADALFAVQSWLPPAPPPPRAAAPVAPEAPPFPYPYMGGLTDDSGRTAYFMRAGRVLSVHAGETVDGTYRVDQLDETEMTLTYLPLNKTVPVEFGEGR
jgi:hypothetical protein